MKKLLTVIALALFTGSALFAADLGWGTNYEKAVTEAKAKNLPILALFTGSDWCPACMMLEKNALTKPDFKAFTKGKVVLLYVDFPRNKKLPTAVSKQNESLATKYKIESFPTTLILSSTGDVVGTVVGALPEKMYIEQLKKFIEKK